MILLRFAILQCCINIIGDYNHDSIPGQYPVTRIRTTIIDITRHKSLWLFSKILEYLLDT